MSKGGRDDLERCIEQTEELIREARETIEKTKSLLSDHGFNDENTVANFLMSDNCPEELRERARLGQEVLDRELEEGEKRLIDEYVREPGETVAENRYRGPRAPRIKI